MYGLTIYSWNKVSVQPIILSRRFLKRAVSKFERLTVTLFELELPLTAPLGTSTTGWDYSRAYVANVESNLAGNKKKRAIRLLMLDLVEDDEDEVRADRRFWVRPFIARRCAMGAYQSLVKELHVCSLTFASCFASCW